LLARHWLVALPYLLTSAIALFGSAGMVAGLAGMPRRVLDVAYDGGAPAIWTAMSPLIATGAVLMGLTLLLYVGLLVAAMFGAGKAAQPAPALLAMPDRAALSQTAWTAPLCVLVLVGGMYVATVLAFGLLRSLPILTAAGAGH
jgi:cytochrome c oxidase subunit 1